MPSPAYVPSSFSSRFWTGFFAFFLTATGLLLTVSCGAPIGGSTLLPGAVADAGTLALPPDPVTQLVGELHLHQFPLGGHAWAAFIDTPVAAADVHTDELVELFTTPSAAAGDCILYSQPTCAPACGNGSWCAGINHCQPLPRFHYIDGGPLHITGSTRAPTIDLHFTQPNTGYDSMPPAGPAALFAGGETLHLTGGTGATRLEADLGAPIWVQMLQPDLVAPLHFPKAGPLSVRWAPAGANQMILILGASTQTTGATIRCVTSDSGTLEVPASLMSALPAAPRQIRLELERDDQRILKTITPGAGFLAHAAFSAWQNGED